MKILLSAYACEPDIGSEPGVGWHVAIELRKLGHEVWVLTRANNRERIERKLKSMRDAGEETGGLQFVYYDLSGWMKWWKKGRQGIHLYYLLWQWGAYRLARELHAEQGFDLVHHVTFVSLRQPSFMGRLGIPFVFGPISGGDSIPRRLRAGSGWRNRLHEALRDAVNAWVRFDPLMRGTFKRAVRVYATSAQTRTLMPRKYQAKTKLKLAIGIDPAMATRPDEITGRSAGTDGIKVLYVGHLLHLKGIHLGMRGFAKLVEAAPGSRLTIVGRGSYRGALEALANELGIGGRIDWVDWVKQTELKGIYEAHDVFLFPSLRDSGGMALLEAMARSLPGICLNLGGPGQMVDEGCGRCIGVEGLDDMMVGEKLGAALVELARDPALRARLSVGAFERAMALTWGAGIEDTYRDLEQVPGLEPGSGAGSLGRSPDASCGGRGSAAEGGVEEEWPGTTRGTHG